jgi:hypothetical protein
MAAKTKIVFLLAGLLVLFFVGLSSVATYYRAVAPWRRKAMSSAPAARQVAFQSSAPGKSDSASEPSSRETAESHAMSNAFDEGYLAPPSKAPDANPDDAAASLAKQIATRDEGSTSALLRAIQMSGYSVRQKVGKGFLVQADKGSNQGMAFQAWEVAAMAKLYDENWNISLEDFRAILTKFLPQLSKLSFRDQFLNPIVASSQGPQPLRFWSRLIIELGRDSRQPYDLSSSNLDLSSSRLDAIQVALILERLSGDLRTLARPTSPRINKSSIHEPEWRMPALEEAVYHPAREPRLISVDEVSIVPCSISDEEATALDLNAILKTTEWKNIIQIEGEGESSAAAQMNAVMTLVRFYLIYAGLHADISLDKSPLVRTKDLDKGEQGKLTAHVWFELGNWPNLSCLVAILRIFLNTTNLDFGNLPNQGDVPGVGVSWFLTEGGVNTNIIPKDQATVDLYNATSIVQFSGYGFDGLHSLVRQATDDYGKANVEIWGAPQHQDLSHFKLVPVKKRFGVAIEVSFKGADPDKFLGELVDVLGPALGVMSHDVLGGFVAGLTEMLYRMSWRVDESAVFPVQDWKICSKGWQGTISFHHERHFIHTETPRPDLQTTTLLQLTENREFTIISSEGRYDNSLLHANWVGQYKKQNQHIDSRHGPTYWCKQTSSTATETETINGSGRANTDFQLIVSTNANTYLLMLLPNPQELTGIALHGEDVKHVENHASGPNGAEPESDCEDSTSDESYEIPPQPWTILFRPVRGVIDPNSPEELSGSQEFQDPGEPDGKIVISWNLVHCSN